MVKKESQQASKYVPQVGDKVICSHQSMMYEAKVIKSDDDQNKSKFFVHYQGWSKNWDEWVPEDRILKWNEANETLMREQRTQVKHKGSAKKGKFNTSMGTSMNASNLSVNSSLSASPIDEKEPIKVEKEIVKEKEKKTPVPSKAATLQTSAVQRESQSESVLEDLELKRTKAEIKIKLPDELKAWLVDDDNNVKNKKLSIVPAKNTISSILKDYLSHRKTQTKLTTDKEMSLNEFVQGLKYSFNVMVGAHLLYKFERPQYQSILKEHGKNVDLTTIYGVAHFLRMLTKLGGMMAYTNLESRNIQSILGHIQEILKYIKKQESLFQVDKGYQVAPPEYIRQYQRAVD